MYSFTKNLKFVETGYNKYIDDFLSNTGISVKAYLKEWANNNCNYYLIRKYDESESQGKITCIPIKYLRDNFSKGNNKSFKNELEEKEFLFNLFLKKKLVMTDLDNIVYKDKYLSDFFKPYLLQASLTKTIDFAKIKTYENDLESELDMNIGIYDKNYVDKPSLTDKTEWMSSSDLFNFLKKLVSKEDNIYLNHLLFIENKDNYYDTCSSFYNSYFYKHLEDFKKSGKRFMISIILYNSHFNAIVIDKDLKYKNKKGIVYFFDSQGYEKKTIKYNNNYFFIKSDMSIKKSKNKTSNLIYSLKENYHVDILSHYIKELFNIEIFLLNQFVVQLLNSECGIFSLFFLYLNIINPPNKISYGIKNYFTMMFKGDLSISQIRGIFFITPEDKSYNEYNKNISVYNMKNRKCVEYKKLQNKTDSNLKNLYKHLYDNK